MEWGASSGLKQLRLGTESMWGSSKETVELGAVSPASEPCASESSEVISHKVLRMRHGLELNSYKTFS